MIMCVVPEFVAVIGRVAVKVTQPSAMTVFAKKYEHQADVYEQSVFSYFEVMYVNKGTQ